MVSMGAKAAGEMEAGAGDVAGVWAKAGAVNATTRIAATLRQ
jgi:hypothetical protein